MLTFYTICVVYCCFCVVTNKVTVIYNQRLEKKASEKLYLETYSDGVKDWILYHIEKTDASRAGQKVDTLHQLINGLSPVRISIYSTYFNNFISLIVAFFIFIALFFVFLNVYKNWGSNYTKRLENFKKKIEYSSFWFREDNEKIYNAHLTLLKKLDLLFKKDFSKFSNWSQFDEIDNELKSFYSLMKGENKHEILLDINLIQQMFFNIAKLNSFLQQNKKK